MTGLASAELEQLLASHRLPATYLTRLDAVHRPIAQKITQVRRAARRPIVVGICGAQGSGKSTIVDFLAELLREEGASSAVLSLDDLYLTAQERQTLAREVHPLLQTRGVPGTHDLQLGSTLLNALTSVPPRSIALPKFDKAEDDRAGAETWASVQAPVDVVLLEGWCIGARPQSDEALIEPVNVLEYAEDPDRRWRGFVNHRLQSDYTAFFDRLDLLVMLRAPNFETVYRWRSLQETKLAARVSDERAVGRAIMDATALRRFLMHYERITREILREMPARADVVVPVSEDQSLGDILFQHRALNGSMD